MRDFWLPPARLRDKVTPLFDTKKDSQVPRFLVASTDLPTRALVKRAFAQFNIEAEECEGSMEAFASLHKKYDGIIVDFEDVELALQLVAGIRSNSDNGNSTCVIALLPPEIPVKQALSAGANIALNKPLRIDHLARSLRVSFRLTTAAEKQQAAKAESRESGVPLSILGKRSS
jgi:DNA-binding response OmpR family regulator